MRKTNRIMFKAVAILLSLVLLTSCVVSTTFAKYVIRKSTGPITMELEKFGVLVTMTVDDTLVQRVGVDENGNSNVKWSRMGDSASVTIDNLVLYPEDNFSHAINFSFLKYIGDTNNDGKKDADEYENSVAQVPVKLVIKPEISFTKADYKVPTGVFDYVDERLASGKDGTHFFPIQFLFYGVKTDGAYSNAINTSSPWRSVDPEDVEYTISQILNNRTDATRTNPDTGDQVEKEFAAGSSILLNMDNDNDNNNTKETVINGFDLGFRWISNWSKRAYDYDADTTDNKSYYTQQELEEIGTWLTNQTDRNFAISVTFTVSVEQIIST